MNPPTPPAQPDTTAPSANLAETPKFTDIIIAVHGIGIQRRFETVRSVANRLAVSKTLLGEPPCSPVAPQPLGFFHSDVKRMTSVTLLDDAQTLRSGLASIGFAEVYWSDITQDLVTEGRTLEETKAWARTVAARARALLKQAQAEKRPGIVPPDFSLAGEVLDEIIDTVHVLENLFFLADKAGVFHFDLADILQKYISGVQIVTEFSDYRTDILSRFDTAMKDIYNKYCKNDPDVRLHIVAHSEGTVVSLLAMLHAMSGTSFDMVESSNPPVAKPQSGEIPPWLGCIRGFMTIGSPIDKHLLLWPRLWKDLNPEKANGLFRKDRIRWRNYYDFGDPVGFKLDTARLWLHEKHCTAFEFCGCPKCHDDIGFARYMLPGQAHTQYWNDSQVFEHFINTVVRPGSGPAIVPSNKPSVLIFSPLLPYVLSFLLLVLGVFIIHKAVHAYDYPSLNPLQKYIRFTELGLKPPPETSPIETLRAVFGIAFLIAGATFMARFPRLAVGPCWRRLNERSFVKQRPWLSKLVSALNWKIVGISAFALGSLLYCVLVPPQIRGEIIQHFRWPTLAIILIAGFTSVVGLLATSPCIENSDRRQRWFFTGMRPLILCGGLALAAVFVCQMIPPAFDPQIVKDASLPPITTNEIEIVKQTHLTSDELKQVISARGTDWIATLERVQTVLATHSDAWPVLLCGAAFLYLWWLATLVFDLAFIWHRYVRHSVTNDRLLEWNPYGFALRNAKGEERANIHYP